ncbi:MAG: sensor histidine kinase [Fluviicola sp.]|jgi:two-component system phosphate regulon sensor histidine kinase PhoR
MKNSSPLVLVLLGSLVLGSVTLIALIITKFFIDFPLWFFGFMPFAISLSAFIVYFFLIRRYIHNRLRVLYRSIRTEKMNNIEKPIIPMNVDIIQIAENEAKIQSKKTQSELKMLREQEAFRKEFLGNVAHELKTPTFAIQGYIDTVLESGFEDREFVEKFLTRASISAERLTHILKDLDELIKLETNRLQLSIRPFDIYQLAQEIMDSFEIQAKQKNITLTFTKEHSKEKWVLADRSRISQVFINLIANSIFYGKENGRTEIRFYIVDDLITIEVADDGPGIDSKDIPRLFERFYRVEKSRSRNEGGSGLGLSIVKYILEAHKKTITVRSTVGVGSTFSFSLDRDKSGGTKIITSRGIHV